MLNNQNNISKQCEKLKKLDKNWNGDNCLIYQNYFLNWIKKDFFNFYSKVFKTKNIFLIPFPDGKIYLEETIIYKKKIYDLFININKQKYVECHVFNSKSDLFFIKIKLNKNNKNMLKKYLNQIIKIT